MDISVVIPAYNEEKRISRTLKLVHCYLASWHTFDIIVVDDGSADRTTQQVREFARQHRNVRLLRNKRNRGKGYSVRKGMLAAKRSWVLFSDADLSTPIQELENFRRYTRKHPIIIGSRRMPGSSIRVQQPWYRRIPGKVFPVLVNLMLLPGIKDSQCGFKLFRKDAARTLCRKQRLEGFSFDAELLWLARRYGLSLKEVGVVWDNDLDSKLHPIKNSYTMFVELLRIRLNQLKGLYR